MLRWYSVVMTIIDDDIKHIRTRFEKLSWALDERMRRLFAAAEASVLGHGGVTKVAQATIRITRNEFHGEWNYRIDPNNR